MVGLFDFGGPQYGLQDGKVAVNNLDGTFGANVDVPSIQMLQAAFTAVTAVLEGDDEETAQSTRIVSGTMTFRFGSIDMDVLEVLLGQAVQSSGTGDESYRFIDITNFNPPYFGIIGRADAAEGTGDTHLFIPKCKITEGFTLKFEYNTFSIPEITAKCFPDTNFLDENGRKIIIRPIMHGSAIDATLPPTYEAA